MKIEKLTEKALIATLNISQWVARREDKRATKAVENEFHTNSHIGNFQKNLVDKDYIKPITQIAQEMRQFHNSNTLAWGDNGDRLLPIGNYMEYMAKMLSLKSAFQDEAKKFIAIYPEVVDKARQELNGLFKDSDYPKHIEDKFGVRIMFNPVPVTDDIRVTNLSDDDIQEIKNGLQFDIQDRLNIAVKDIVERIKVAVGKIAERLEDPDNKFKDSLIGNLKDLIKVIPKLNLFNDPKINEVTEEMKKLVVDPDTLRKNKSTRKLVKASAEEVLKKVDGYFN